MSKLLEALKRKYRNPREAIQALGLDSRDLEADLMAGDTALEGNSANDAVVGSTSKENVDMAIKSRTALLTTLGLASLLRPKLAQDATLDLRPILKGITAANFSESKPAIFKKLRVALKGKLAKDASIGEVAELLDLIDGHGGGGGGEEDAEVPAKLGGAGEKVGAKFAEKDSMDAEPLGNVHEFLKGKLSDDDHAKVMDMLKGGGMHEHGMDDPAETGQEKSDNKHEWRRGEKEDTPATDEEGHAEGGAQLKKLGAASGEDDEEEYEEAKREGPGAKDTPPPFKGSPKVGGSMVKGGDSAKSIQDAVKVAVDAARKTERDIRDAERFVQPWVGQLNMNFDSAEQVYRQALKLSGVRNADSIKEVVALKTILELQPLPGVKKVAAKVSAMDAANVGSFNERFPDIKRIRLT